MGKVLCWKNRNAASGIILEYPDDAAWVDLPAPETHGLHVWTKDENGEGAWRRATARDLEEFGVPLSEEVVKEEEQES